MQAGGIIAVNATCAVWETAAETLRAVGNWTELVNRNSDLAFLAENGSDIQRARTEKRIAVFLGFQNTSPFEDDYRMVEAFHRLGVRVAQLTYNNQNLLGGGCFEPNDSGLTKYGRIIVSEMNRVGMLIDLSHVGEKTSLDAIEAASGPVAITHSNPLWFHDTPRNKSDKVIKALVDKGGVIGACLYPTVSGGSTATIERFTAMVAQLVDQFGPEHIAIGSDCTRGWNKDFVGWLRNGRWNPTDPANAPEWPAWPHWFKSPADFPQLADGLSTAGLSDQAVAGVLSQNWEHLFKTVMDKPSLETAPAPHETVAAG